MYGDLASGLLRLFSQENRDIIPKYQHDIVENIRKENEELYAENLRTSQSAAKTSDEETPDTQDGDINIDEKDLMLMQVRHTAKLWNKRCIIAYHYERLQILKKLRWEYGNNLPLEIVNNLSADEMDWFTKYSDNLFNYMSSLNEPDGLDLTLYQNPPRRLFVTVKCLKDYGQLDIGDGPPVTLKQNNIYYLPLSQCEKLIHQGLLQKT